MDDFIKEEGSSIWKVIRYFEYEKSEKDIYFRYYFTGDIWLLRSLHPEDFIWLIDAYDEYMPSLVDEICKTAYEQGIDYFENYDSDKYVEIHFIF